MKKLIILLTVFLLANSVYDLSAQTYDGKFYEFYFGRQPSARAEAMGRSIASLTGDPLSYYYNPAGMGSLKGLNLCGTFAGPNYNTPVFPNSDKAKYNFFSASYSIPVYGNVSLSRDYFNFGYEYEYIRTDEFGNPIATEKIEPDITNYRLTLSSEVIKDLYAGLNLNLLQPDTETNTISVGNETGSDGSENVFYFDLGLLKSFHLKSKNLDQNISLGTSLINVNSASSSPGADQGDELPVIFRIGASYDLTLNDSSISSKLNSYSFLLNAEYEDLFNSKYFGGFHTGLEFNFLEIVSLRGGFYTQKNNQRNFVTDTNGVIISIENLENNWSEFTYGFGLNIPLNQLTNGKTPIEIKFDYTNLSQPALREGNDSPGRYSVFSFLFNWIL